MIIKHFFICQTPFQLTYADLIIESISQNNLSNHKFFLYHSGLKILNTNNQVKYLNYKSKKKLEIISLISAFQNFKGELKSNRNNQSYVYFSHIGGLFSNYIFYSKKPGDNIDLCLFYEGVLSFYDFRERFNLSHLKRIILATILGFFYRYNPVICPYDSNKITKIFTPFPHYTKGDSKKIVKIDFKKEYSFKTTKQKSILILGGPVTYLKEFYDEIISYITLNKKNQTHKLFYKGHSSFLRENKKFKNLFDEMLTKENISFDSLDITLPIENILKTIKVDEIHSYYSSSLINIKAIHQHTKLYCYIKDSNQPKEIVQIFDKNGIVIKPI